MKAEHRHELETNALAKRLAVVVEQLRPYAPTVIGIVVACLLGLIAFSYFSGASAAQRKRNLERLQPGRRRSDPQSRPPQANCRRKRRHPRRSFGQRHLGRRATLDGLPRLRPKSPRRPRRRQSRSHRLRKPAAIDRKPAAHQSGSVRPRPRLRIAKRARQSPRTLPRRPRRLRRLSPSNAPRRLADQKSKEIYEWLASAQAPRPAAPAGSGTPGQRPDFSAGDLEMPSADKGLPAEPSTATTDDLLKGFLPDEGKETKDRYQTGDDKAKSDAPAK